MGTLALVSFFWMIEICGCVYGGQPADSTSSKTRVLVGSSIRQKPTILKEFLESLDRQARVNYSVDYFFVDDNVEEESHHMLTQFQQKLGDVCHIESPIQDQSADYWGDSAISKVAACKDRMIERTLANEYDYLFLIDSNIVLHPDTIDTLMKDKKEVVSNIVWTPRTPDGSIQPQVWLFNTPETCPFCPGEVLSRDEIARRSERFIAQLKVPGVYEVGGLGACTLISKAALLKGVCFKRITNLSFCGEDRHFCVRAAALGISLCVDTCLPVCYISSESALAGVPHYKWACEHHAPLPLVPTPRLTLSMCMRNEVSGCLRRVLESAKTYINDAVIIDDASTDESVAICKEVLQGIPFRIVQNKESKFANEVELRSQQWEETIKVNPDWILVIDADEIFENRFANEIGTLLRDNDVDLYRFRRFDLWDEWFYRDDLYWRGHTFYFPFLARYKPGIEYRWKNTPQHCGSFPLTVLEFPHQKLSDLRLKHYGWATLERRQDKAARYARLDPEAKYGWKEQYESILDPNPNLVPWSE